MLPVPARARKNGIQAGKEEVKAPLFTADTTLYRQKILKNSTKNKLSKAAGYKINTQKPAVFLDISNKHCEKEIKKTMPFTIASKRIKYS